MSVPDVGHRSVAVAEAAAGQPDLPEQRGERDRRPHRLLAVLGALQRPGRGDQRPAPPPCAARARARSTPGRRRSPRPTPASSRRRRSVARKRVGAGAAAIEEGAVVQVLGDEHVAQREHDRRVRARARWRMPLRAQAGMDVVVDRAEQHDLHAAPRAVREVLADGVAGHAAGDDGQVLDRDAAERHEQVGVARDDLPRRRPAPHLVRAADDVAQRDVARRRPSRCPTLVVEPPSRP